MQRQSAIHSLAARQHGVVTRRQLVELGWSAGGIDHLRRSGRLVRIERGVYAVGHAELRPAGRLLATILSVGPGAVASHRTAARVLGLRPWSGAFEEVTIRSHRGTKRRTDVRIHRSEDLAPEDVTVVDAIPVTSVARTLVDLAASVPAHHLRRAVERAEELELFDLRAVERVLTRRAGRPGAPALATLLADLREHGLTRTRSDPEAGLLQLCLDHGLPRPRLNVHADGREFDAVWPEHRLIVEVDSWRHHGTRAKWRADRSKDRHALRAGWRTARFDTEEIERAPNAVAAELDALLRLG